MSSTIFIFCLILTAIMMTIHPALAIPFGAAALMIAKKCRMDLNSDGSIVLGIIGFIALLTLAMCIRSTIR
ncbi:MULTISPECIES: hypothetical protein [Dickeya]|uniref:Uncharacterized protein n=1 Tax=Dickeya aquatica TaxID=1401087 RepID=A0A375ABP9_9GAMM|nr:MULTISPECIES: hypothetical protein [Dickeya]SLM63480.1 hypothetical protein DAQ1742_02607 [Dickeya aquatica]